MHGKFFKRNTIFIRWILISKVFGEWITPQDTKLNNKKYIISPWRVNCFEAERLLSNLILAGIPSDISVIDSSIVT